MKTVVGIALTISFSIFSASRFAYGQQVDDYVPGQWVTFQDGEISAAFRGMPVHFALNALHAKTGLQIEIPKFAADRLVNLRIDRQPLEPAVRAVIFSIGFKNFALMYDSDGRPNRAVVASAGGEESGEGSRAPQLESQAPEAVLLPLTPEERDAIDSELDRWKDLSKEERGRIEDRLTTIPASEDRNRLVEEYGRRVLGIEN